MSDEKKTNDSKKTEEVKETKKSFMESTKEFLAEPVTRSDVAIVIAVAVVGVGSYYGYQKYQGNKELSEDSGLEIKNIA